MSKRKCIIFIATVATCTFCGAVSICISDEVKKSANEEAFAMHFDKTYEALIEKLTGLSRSKFGGGVSVHQIVFGEMLDEAKSLAEHAGPGAELYLKSEVEDQIDRPGGAINKPGTSVSGRFRLALLTLSQIGSDDARDTLRHFLSRENTFLGVQTVIAISYLPQQRAKSLLEGVLQNPDRIAEPLALEWAASLLAAIGDNNSMAVLKSLNGKENRLKPDFLTKKLRSSDKTYRSIIFSFGTVFAPWLFRPETFIGRRKSWRVRVCRKNSIKN